MPVSIAFIRKLDDIDPQLRQVLLSMLEELERQREESVTKKEFNELKEIVRDLGKTIKELAEAQKRTEARLEAFEKQTEENFNRVWKAINELTEAQKRTEARLEAFEKQTEENFNRVWETINELTKAQKRTEARVEELAEAQKKTEEEITKLVKRMDAFEGRLEKVEGRLEGISNSVGYSLENAAYKALPRLLAERYGLEVEGRLIRRYLTVNQKEIQINIYGYGRKNGKRLLVLGECKVRPSRKEVGRFEKYARRIAKQEGTEAFLLFVAHDFPPKIEQLLQEKGIMYFWSYELD